MDTRLWRTCYSDVLEMKITSVRSFLMSYPLPEPLKLSFYGGERTIVKRDAMLIRVETDNGLIGYAPGPGSEIAHRGDRIDHRAFPRGPHAGRSRRSARPVFRSAGVRSRDRARSTAPWKSRSTTWRRKAQGVPVSELLGGRVRDRIRLYGSAGMYMAPERYAEEAAGVAELGFQAYKMRPALRTRAGPAKPCG